MRRGWRFAATLSVAVSPVALADEGAAFDRLLSPLAQPQANAVEAATVIASVHRATCIASPPSCKSLTDLTSSSQWPRSRRPSVHQQPRSSSRWPARRQLLVPLIGQL